MRQTLGIRGLEIHRQRKSESRVKFEGEGLSGKKGGMDYKEEGVGNDSIKDKGNV